MKKKKKKKKRKMMMMMKKKKKQEKEKKKEEKKKKKKFAYPLIRNMMIQSNLTTFGCRCIKSSDKWEWFFPFYCRGGVLP
jgi:hypothetical protein